MNAQSYPKKMKGLVNLCSILINYWAIFAGSWKKFLDYLNCCLWWIVGSKFYDCDFRVWKFQEDSIKTGNSKGKKGKENYNIWQRLHKKSGCKFKLQENRLQRSSRRNCEKIRKLKMKIKHNLGI